MSSVTFDVAVGGDGSTVTDDDNASTGLREGGWKTRFVPCFTQQVAVANYVMTEANAIAALDNQYLGAKASNPTVNNSGGALVEGNLYFNSVANEMRVWSGSAWLASYLPAGSYLVSADIGVTVQAYTANAPVSQTQLEAMQATSLYF